MRAGGDGKVIITLNAAVEFYLGEPGPVTHSPGWLQPELGDERSDDFVVQSPAALPSPSDLA